MTTYTVVYYEADALVTEARAEPVQSMPTLLPLAILMTMSAAYQLQLDDLHDDAQDAINDT